MSTPLMQNPSIRPANPSDAERMSTLITALSERHILMEFSATGRDRFQSDHTPAVMLQRIQAGFQYHVAEAGDALEGIVGIRNGSHLFHLFVAEDWQGRGLGRRLWQHALRQCQWAPALRKITVNSSRNAVAVYEKFGFRVCGSEQDVGGVRFVPMKLEI